MDKKHYKGINIYYIGYITVKTIFGKYLQCKSFVFGHWRSKWTFWRKNGSKYLVFDSTDANRKVLEKYTELWDSIKNEISL